MPLRSFGDKLDILRAESIVDPFTYGTDISKRTLFEFADIDLDKSANTGLTGCKFFIFV